MWSLLACQAPFGADRHDLVDFRVAALTAPPALAGDAISPRVALIVDGHPWSDRDIDLLWYWVDGPDDVEGIDPTWEIAGTGPAPMLVVPRDQRALGLLARDGDRELRAYFALAEPPDKVDPPARIEVATLPLALEAVEGPELLLDARRGLSATPADGVPVGGFARFTAEVDGDPLVRWMATAGTFFELDRAAADWAAGDLLLDEDEIDDGRAALPAGAVTVLALALGEPGQTAFRATDLYVGPAPDGVWVEGRFVPTDGPVAFGPGEVLRGTFTADDTSPTGVRLVDAAAEPGSDVFAWGTPWLACAVNLDGPFDPNWLLAGVCTRPGIEGIEVVVIPQESR
ncbi:MAG: hypothetical protein ABMA64_12715 [Myxococcota bacterium]